MGPRRARQRGQSLLEFALIVPLLLLLGLGVVDAGRALHTGYQLSRLSREGANLIARGSALTSGDLDLALRALTASAAPALDLEGQGVVLVSILRGTGGAIDVLAQRARGGLAVRSRAGGPGDRLDARQREAVLHGEPLREGQLVVYVETYYRLDLLMPVDRLFGVLTPEQRLLGSQTVFFFS